MQRPQVPLSTSNGIFYGTNGQATTLMGVNWFGFETSATMVAGLWQGPTALSQDFSTVLYRIQLLGFNTIRLPFSFQVRRRTCRFAQVSEALGCHRHAPRGPQPMAARLAAAARRRHSGLCIRHAMRASIEPKHRFRVGT